MKTLVVILSILFAFNLNANPINPIGKFKFVESKYDSANNNSVFIYTGEIVAKIIKQNDKFEKFIEVVEIHLIVEDKKLEKIPPFMFHDKKVKFVILRNYKNEVEEIARGTLPLATYEKYFE